MRRNRTVLFAAAAVAALLSAPAVAQQQMQGGMMHDMQGTPGMMYGQGMQGMMMGGPMMGNMGAQMMGGGPATHIEGRLAFLKTELGITESQMDVWQDYVAAVRDSAGSMQKMHDMMMSGDWPTSFPERMERHEQMMSARVETLTKLREAAVPLYEELDDGQKQMADRILGMGMM